MTPLQILVVDDNDVDRYILKRMIDMADTTVELTEQGNGDAALSYLRSLSSLPDLIFVDINMPIVDGWQFLDALAQLPEPSSRQDDVVMFSSSALAQERERALAHPRVHTYLVKGEFTPQHIVDLLTSASQRNH